MRPSFRPAVTALDSSPIRQPMAALTSRKSKGNRQPFQVLPIHAKKAVCSSGEMTRGGFLSHFGGSTSANGSIVTIFSVFRSQWPNTIERLPTLPSTVLGDNGFSSCLPFIRLTTNVWAIAEVMSPGPLLFGNTLRRLLMHSSYCWIDVGRRFFAFMCSRMRAKASSQGMFAPWGFHEFIAGSQVA